MRRRGVGTSGAIRQTTTRSSRSGDGRIRGRIASSLMQTGNREEKMAREPVNSSNLAEVGYDQHTQTLEVCFKSGRTYQYFDVPEQVYEGLKKAGSPGAYLNSAVKGSFRYARV